MAIEMANEPERDHEALDDKVDDGQRRSKVEIQFAIPVMLRQEDLRTLDAWVSRIVKRVENQPHNQIHWVAGHGDKPLLSAVDQVLLYGHVREEPGVANGEEPRYDETCYHIETSMRNAYAGEICIKRGDGNCIGVINKQEGLCQYHSVE